MRTYLILSLSLLPLMSSKAQNFQEATLETTLTKATVFIEGAQVTREGQIELPPGRSELIIKQLSPHIDEQSIQVKAVGDLTILSVNHQQNHVEELEKLKAIMVVEKTIDSLVDLMNRNEVRIEVLNEKENLLNINKKLGGKEQGASVTELKEAIDFYDRQLMAIKSEIIKLDDEQEDLERERENLNQQIAAIRKLASLPTGEIKLRVEANAKTSGKFIVSYQVANAGWFPKYDIRVNHIDEPLALRYKADIHQNTGVDWENVILQLSNGTPGESGVAPEMVPWQLNYARNTVYQRYQNGRIRNNIGQVRGRVVDDAGDAIPGVNVVVKGTTVGTSTDLDGYYSLTLPNGATTLSFSFIGLVSQEIPITSSNISPRMQENVEELQEVVVTAYGIEGNGRSQGYSERYSRADKIDAEVVTTTVVENQTTVAFQVDEPYSIPSNGEKLTVDLTTYNIDASYEYFAAPKLDKDAFLMAYLTDWEQYKLLEGEANLYFEDTFVGRTILNAKTLKDTLSISMGRDKSIVIGRTKVDAFTKVKTIGSNQVESRGYKILVRNKKNQAVKLTLTDQIPVAAISAITVDINELSGASLNESSGLIHWDLTLNPQEQQEVQFSYSVKYPKREVVNLD